MINGLTVSYLAIGTIGAIKANPTFPYDTGHLMHDATYIGETTMSGFNIVFDDYKAHYIKFLEEGTVLSTKHVGFIEDRATNDAMNFICQKTGGRIVY
jgi:hypothetical protein